MAFNKIARKDSDFYVICTLPDFCWAPPPAPPVTPPIPFPLFADLGNAKTVAKDVRLNRKPAFVFKASKTNRTTGDEPALPGRKGILSRTATKPAWPMMHSSSVKIRKRHIIRAGDMFHMNNKFKKKLPPKPCISCKAAAAAGRPVNPIHGLKFLEKETDFAFEGILPLVWSRSYYSDQDGTGWLGEGWSVPGCQRIIRDAAGLAYIDDQGRLFPLPEVDEDDEEPVLFESEQIWFSKNPDGHYVIASLDGSIALRFAPLVVAEDGSDEDATLFPLVAVEDANGNHQRFVYHPLTGLPQYVIDGNGRVFSLNFGNVADEQSPKMRLLSVSLLEGLPVFGETVRVGSPLVRYEYNNSGDLVRVIGRDGNVKRSFGYKNNLMVSHTDAAGLVSEYEYDHYTPTGKVLRNWTSLGEEWRFTYHDGYTEVTDVLGRTEQYHYDYNNELTKRVFADGSAVLMERDGLGRLLSHTDAMGRVTRYQYSNEGQVEAIVRPDGAILHFDYDDCYRLIRKSDAEGRYDGYTYDEAGNLLTHTDPLKHTTRFEYADNGLLLSVTDPNGSSTAYHYNENRQPDLITDCSGYETKLAYTPEGQLARITDALGQHTEYHYDADQNLTLALYPDGSKETFGYDAAGRLKTHTDGEGHTTSYEYGQDGLPTRRTNALGHTFGYHYDKARRLVGLTNENGARYRFAYDVLDRLIAESGFDHKLTGYRYNAGNELVEQREFGDDASLAAKLMAQLGGQPVPKKDVSPLSDDLDSQTPLRITEFKRDILGRLIHTLARDNDKVQETAYQYDLNGNLVRAANCHSITCFDYNGNGQLIAQHQWKVPSKEENARNGLPDTDWRDAQYDMLYLPVTETVRYHYDFNGNRTATVLPDGRQINYLYYGSGHLHQISLDDEVITDIERDKLHREIYRTQGKLASRYELDPLGRLKRQIATLNDLTEGGKGKTKVAAGYGQTAVKRSYGYDRTGNLTHSTDQRTGTTKFEYDKLGRITQAGNELFAFDPAHNILSDGLNAIPDNRLKTYNGTTYYYDKLGNLIHRELADGEMQNYFYDLHDQLVKAEIFKKDGTKETWSYTYDALGRRIGKGRLKNEEASDSLENQTRFVWDGSHLLQEVQPDGRYTYIYADQDSYEPLAQVHNRTNEDGESCQQTYYFHCDQIGIPREMTDKDGNLLWLGNYTGWGRLKEETKVTDSAYQPFRLQNQYADRETGLHYNFFRYYEPDAGRFVNQDPIGLFGGENLYSFALNTQVWIDPLGLSKNAIQVSMNKALPDVESRGVHVNVKQGKKSMHIEIVGKKLPDGKFKCSYEPADPTAKNIKENNPSQWKKIVEAVDDFVQNPKNKAKLKDVAEAAVQNFPNNTRDFSTTLKALGG